MEKNVLSRWKKRAFLERKTKNKSDERIFKIVDKVLKQIFGEAATIAVYRYLEEKYSLKREDIPSNPEVFAEGLERCLDSGAFVVVERVLNESAELGLKRTADNVFFKQLREMKRNFYS